MTIASKKPPYPPEEIEKIARALVVHEAHGDFYVEETCGRCFKIALEKISPAYLLESLEGGMVYVVGFLPGGIRFDPRKGLPRIHDFFWFDAVNAKKLLRRAYDLEATENLDLSKLGHGSEVDDAVDLYEKIRLQKLPDWRAKIRKHIKGG